MKQIIYKPKGTNQNEFNHAGDTFREMLDLWEENGFIEIRETNETGHVWWDNIGKVLLYDRPTYKWLNKSPRYELCLCGNSPPQENINKENQKPWIFWGRHPRVVEKWNQRKPLKYARRDINSIFIGKIENEIQQKFRIDNRWKTVIEKFDLQIGGHGYKYSQDDYFNLLSRSKFGLCLRGYGPKCNREIELMAMGVIPLITPDVDLTYYNNLIEGYHYLRVNEPKDVNKVINNIDSKKWDEMSVACRSWYQQNCSVEGSFYTTKMIIQKFYMGDRLPKVFVDANRLNTYGPPHGSSLGNKILHLFFILKYCFKHKLQPVVPIKSNLDNLFDLSNIFEDNSKCDNIAFVEKTAYKIKGDHKSTIENSKNQFNEEHKFLEELTLPSTIDFSIRGHFTHKRLMPLLNEFEKFISIHKHLIEEILSRYKTIKDEDNVCIHYRGTDFARHECGLGNLILPEDYYKCSIFEMERLLQKNLTYHIFSDEPDKIIKMLPKDKNYIIHRDTPELDWVSLFLCRNLISSNSSFCWTASLFNKKIVTQPKGWLNTKYNKYKGNIPYDYRVPHSIEINYLENEEENEEENEDMEQMSVDNKNEEEDILQSICTMATKDSWDDLYLFIRSVASFHPDLPLYIICDKEISKKAKNAAEEFDIEIYTRTILDRYSSLGRQKMEAQGIWTDFMLKKCDAIDMALANNTNTIFLDCDIVLFDCLDDYIVKDKEIGISRHWIKENNEQMYGKYNGGFVYVNTPNFTLWWKNATKTSRYMEQACLEDTIKDFTVFEFPINCNFGWWRLFESDVSPQERLKKFSLHDNKYICYAGRRLQSIHTHFGEKKFGFTVNFNKLMKQMLKECFDTDVRDVFKHIMDYFGEPCLNVILQYCNHPNPERQKELDYCVLKNLNNSYVEFVHNLVENKTNVPSEIKNHPKYKEYSCNHWLKYKDIFDYSNKYLQGKLTVTCNLDIFLDQYYSEWDKIGELIDKGIVYCLSRYEYLGDGKAKKDEKLENYGFATTQDAWVWRSPITINDCDFEIGMLGCDNAIADRIKNSGKVPFNCPLLYRIFHYDLCRNKSGENFMDIHEKDKKRRSIENKHPEEKGQYLLPDLDFCERSVDKLMEKMNLDDVQKYMVMCDVMSKFLKINNRK